MDLRILKGLLEKQSIREINEIFNEKEYLKSTLLTVKEEKKFYLGFIN